MKSALQFYTTDKCQIQELDFNPLFSLASGTVSTTDVQPSVELVQSEDLGVSAEAPVSMVTVMHFLPFSLHPWPHLVQGNAMISQLQGFFQGILLSEGAAVCLLPFDPRTEFDPHETLVISSGSCTFTHMLGVMLSPHPLRCISCLSLTFK